MSTTRENQREQGILGAWKLLEGAGLAKPWRTEDDLRNGLRTWALVLGDAAPERVLALTVAWLRSGDAKYGRWPAPGALLQALGDADEIDDADDAWGEVLALLQARGRDWCVAQAPTADHVLELDQAMRARAVTLRERGDALLADQQERRRKALPHGPLPRLVAVYAGLQACGGWRGLAQAEDLVAHRASFRSAYRSQLRRRQLEGQEADVVALLGPATRRLVALPGGGR